MADNNQAPPPFSGFSDLYPKLTPLLDNVKKAAPTGTTIPQKTSGAQPPAYVTDAGAKAYATARGGDQNANPKVDGAQQIIGNFVKTLSDTQVGYLSGLNFTKPPNSDRDDVTNSALTAWDKSASKYMNNLMSDGDSARTALQTRLQEFDTAIQTAGQTAVTPDS